ncbi:MAG TPA: MmpS family transport accessory protein [Pyrinomonadaceae bacterium]|nr:MmpS family transport accessory protein [Pyrinomonadaceae bacterium]
MKIPSALAVLVLLAAILGCVLDTREHEVVYEVKGSASSASLTYQNQHGDGEQIETVNLPWQLTRKGKSGDFLYISAQNLGESGTITTTISIDGKTVKSTTSKGGHVIATSSTSCCRGD